jgi:hypothetical protein
MPRHALLLLLLALAASPEARAAPDPLVRLNVVRVNPTENRTAVTIVLNGETKSHIKLAKGPQLPHPILVILLDNARLPLRYTPPAVEGDGRIRGVKVAAIQGGRVRVMIEMEEATDYYVSLVPRPYSIIVTISPAESGARAEPAPEAPPPKKRAQAAKKPLSAWLRPSAQLREMAASRTHEPSGLSMLKSTALLGATGKLSENVSYKVGFRSYYDGVFALSHRYSQDARDNMQHEDQLREAYFDVSAGSLDLRLGRQQIVWGESVGLFVADVVNARDLRDFILPEFEQIRTPQWAAQAEYSVGDTHLEAVGIPVLEFDRLPPEGSEFSPPLPPISFAGIPIPIVTDAAVRPGNTPRNYEYGGRISQLAGGWDLSAFYWNAWDLSPAFPRTIDLLPSGPAIVLHPEHFRLNTTGGTFSKDMGPFVLKGEAAYQPGKMFIDLDPFNTTGLVRRDLLQSTVGADFTVGDRLTMNVQAINRTIARFRQTILDERSTITWGSAWMKLNLWDGHVEPEVMIIRGLGFNDLMMRPKLTLKTGGHWQASAGADFFYGDPVGLFGRYAGHDRVWGEARFYF